MFIEQVDSHVSPGEPAPTCGHLHLWRKIKPFKIKHTFYFKRVNFEDVFKSGMLLFPILLQFVHL